MAKKHFTTRKSAEKYAEQNGGKLHDNRATSTKPYMNFTVKTESPSGNQRDNTNLNQEYDGRDDFYTFGYPDEYWED